MNPSTLALDLSENGYMPDSIIRRGIRLLIKQRLNEINATNPEHMANDLSQFIYQMNRSPIAIMTSKANEQHYEIPSHFYKHVLGDHQKYSCCYWENSTSSLTEAEELALKKTCENADISDGMSILELGCGWGSLTLYMAQKFPNSHITAVSNSNSQKEHILQVANTRCINNISVITCDMNTFQPENCFDRVVSVEMMEHMRNYQRLYKNIASWLNPNGKLFKHIFVHRSTAYPFDVKDDSDWMSQYFFSGGMMPSDDLPLWFQEDLRMVNRWRWSGSHYQKTANSWLENIDFNADLVLPIVRDIYGENEGEKWLNRWRLFFMACAELFGYNNGNEWWVSHYLFEKK